MATESKPPGSEEPILNVVGERVALGPLREDLLPLYGRWINDFSTISMLGLPPAPVTAEKERDWHEGRSRAENDLMFTIYERENLRPIGNIGLHGLDHRNRSASFGNIIGNPSAAARDTARRRRASCSTTPLPRSACTTSCLPCFRSTPQARGSVSANGRHVAAHLDVAVGREGDL